MAPAKVHDVCEENTGKRWSLWSGRPFGPNKLFKIEQDSLTALCDALLPSMDVSESNSTKDEAAVSEFYTTSASMAGAPDMVGRMFIGEVQHPSVPLMRLALWLLGTWFGTLILCGRDCLSDKFPYFQKFSKVDVSKRQQILLSWSLSPFSLIRMLFKAIKFVTMRQFFSQVDEKGKNPTWQAMGYIGPDPDSQSKKSKEKEKCKGPLHSILLEDINTKPHQSMLDQLKQAGFPTPTSSPSSNLLTIHCDAVIIGSGSGGSVAASVLAKSGYKVIVVEKGHYYQTTDLSLLEGPTTSLMYEGGGIIATDDVGVLMLAGSTVGGGSSVNWSASIRTPDHVIKDWCHDLGLELFGSDAYQRALDSVCERMSVQPHVQKEGFNNAILRQGCAQLGIPVINVPCNAPPDHYCGWCHLGCKDAKKKSAQETWLVDLVESGNGLIIPGCRALKVLHKKKNGFNRNKATGAVIQFEKLDGQQQVFAIESKITIVACGALNTPPLLKRSGLKNKHIGKNLHVHPCAMAWGYFPEEQQQGWPEKTMRSYEGGILTAMASVVSKADGYGVILQTPALHPGMFSVLMPWVSARDFRERMRRFSRTAHVFALPRDKGTGTTDYPKSITYKLDNSDIENLTEGLVAALKILAAAGAEEIGTHHCDGERFRVKGSDQKEKFDEYLERVRKKMKGRDVWTPISTAHQMGSCRMGVDEKTSAVSPNGETWEVEGLFVVDTSVFPTALGVNPMVTVMATAHCIAHSALRFLEKNI